MLPDGMYFMRAEASMWPASANVLLIRDKEGAILVDAGCGKEEAYSRLKAFIETQGFKAADVHTVVLTHAHPDHMGAMRYLLQEISPRVFLHPVEIPLAAEPARLNETFDVTLPKRYGIVDSTGVLDVLEFFSHACPMARAQATDEINAGEELVLGDFSFLVTVVPGHAQGLVTLFNRENGVLFSADAVGDIVPWYSPSSGGLTGFLEGLNGLMELKASVLLPSHGHPSKDPSKEIDRTKKRLVRREKKILYELDSGPVPFQELVVRVFRYPEMAVFPGTQILQCHLDKLASEGKVLCRGKEDGWLVEITGKR
jgi:glyoxylase-like metal-dependent hydrolase (beta-lactamase superfamily II)